MTWTPTRIHAPFLMDASIKKLLRVFVAAGLQSEIRFVGGCVRNVLMNLPMSDIDLATTLTPDEVTQLFAGKHNVHPTGIEHGTVTVVVDRVPYEITTLRRDVETDGRRATISFTKDWAEDAERRDFRCNAIYMDSNGVLFDPTGGVMDAMERVLTFVGDADTRIREDYLRILRLFRFQATLNASSEASAAEACSRQKAGIATLSGERIEKEMLKLLGAKKALRAVRSMIDTGVYEEVFGTHHDFSGNVFFVSNDPVLRLAALLWKSPEATEACLQRWRSSNELKARVRASAKGPVDLDVDHLRLVAYEEGVQAMEDRAILSWSFTDKQFDDVKLMIDTVKNTLPVFPLRGADLVAAGVKQGRMIGAMLKELEVWWIANGYPSEDVCRARMTEIIA